MTSRLQVLDHEMAIVITKQDHMGHLIYFDIFLLALYLALYSYMT